MAVEEAALTGESVAVQKDAARRLEGEVPLGDRKNTAFMGTLVSYGRGKGIVVSTGMRTQIGLVAGWDNWLMCGLIILAASAGKFGGSLAAAGLAGLDWRTSSALGILMNTRGLMELIALNIGLDLGVISPALFAMMVIMALVTTMATSPLLALLEPRALAAAAAGSFGSCPRR